ncbi:MAG: hypothetical protein IT436_00365 [Phycisphaerales bacterium]|nr:hypothetical protein [Phycisphaerales bacterium]
MTQAKPSPARQTRSGVVLCPYCGQPTPAGARCSHCRGLLDPLSRQATQNAMGPWFLRDPANPFRPGCSYSTIKDMAARGRIKPESIIRGPSTRQFWSLAKRTPGVSHLLGLCYACQEEVEPTDEICRFCGVSFEIEPDRQHLGLAPVHLLPGQAPPEAIAESSAALDPAAATVGKVPGSAIPAIDDSAERLVRRLAARLRSQRILVALLSLLTFSALALIGVVIAENRLGGPRPVSTFLLGSPPPPVTAEPGPASAPQPAPLLDTSAPPAASQREHAARPILTPESTPAVIAEQKPIDDPLLPARELIDQGTESSLSSAITALEQLRRDKPDLADACRSLEQSARQRLSQLRLRRLP